MANIKKIKKQLVTLNEEELKDVLDFLVDDEEETVEETQESEKTEEAEQEEEQPSFATLEDVKGLLEEFTKKFTTKEEVSAVTKKAQKFGTDQSKKPAKKDDESGKTSQDYLAKLRNQGY